MENMDMIIHELTAAIEAMDPEILAGGILFWAAAFAAMVAIAVIRYLITSIGHSKMYRKAGEAGWKAFIPVYNTYNNYKISWNGKFFFLYLVLYILATLLGGSAQLLASLIGAAAAIAMLVIAIKQNMKMANRFGKGTGTGIALILFPGITSLILGMGKAEYQAEMIENN